MERREFLWKSAITAGLLSTQSLPNPVLAETIPVQKKYANDIVTLGNTGIEVSRLAMGTGTHGVNKHSSQTRKLGIKGVARLLKAAYEKGISFWDSADQYGTHPHLKEALTLVPRDKVVILSKTHATTAEEMKADLDRFREELNTDYIDILLLHFMTDPQWPQIKVGAMEVLERAREDGIIRAHGVSCHTLGALKAAAESDWVQVDLARINYAGVVMDDGVDTIAPILNKMHGQGKGIIGMKIFGAGQLRNHVDKALNFVLNLDSVDAFTIGQENQKEMFDLIERIPNASVS